MAIRHTMVFCLLLGISSSLKADYKWFPYPVEVWNTPFQMSSSRSEEQYTPLVKATKPWNICVLFPHMKDSYWLAVNFGIAFEAKRLGVKMQLFHADGYQNLDNQISQMNKCAEDSVDAIIVGAISQDQLNPLIKKIKAKNIPVIDLVNGVSSPDVAAKSMVSFREMGEKAGKYLVDKSNGVTEQLNIAWFPGPKGAAWVIAGDQGFKSMLQGSNLKVVTTKYGDTGLSAQKKLLEQALKENQDIDYIVGTAVTAEAATSILRRKGLDRKIKIISYYFAPGVYRGIKRGTILSAPTDSAVIQARIAVDQAVRILENKPLFKHVGPKIYMIDRDNVNQFDRSSALAPTGFKPTFEVQ